MRARTDTYIPVSAQPQQMTIPDWVKALRRRLGYTSADQLAQKLGRSRNAVARWENASRTPNMEAWRKLLALAPSDLRECAPQVTEGLGLVDFGMAIQGSMKGYLATTKEAATVAEEIDSIEEPLLRRRARNAALRCIEEVLRGQGSEPPEPPRPKPSGRA